MLPFISRALSNSIRLGQAAVQALTSTIRNDGIEHAGYISFLFMLTIFPFLIFFAIVAAILTQLYLAKYLDQTLAEALTDIILHSSWANFITALQPRIVEISTTPPHSFLTLALFSMLWTASSIFEALRSCLNKAFQVKRPPPYIWRRLRSIGQFITVVLIIATMTFILKVWPAITDLIFAKVAVNAHGLEPWWYVPASVMWAQSNAVRLGLAVIVLYLYYVLPDTKQNLRQTLPGTITTVCGWWGFSYLFSYYIRLFSQINLIYGSITSIIICLLYFHICSLIFIYGGELNYQLQVTANSSRSSVNRVS